MRLLPWDSFSFDTALSAPDAAERLTNAVEPRRWLRSGRGAKPFEGVVTDYSFAIRRIITYRNSFLPEIRGSIGSIASGSRIQGTMRLHPLVIGFMLLWFSLAGTMTVVALSGLSNPGEDALPLAAPLGMLLFGWALVTLPFAIEAQLARRQLGQLLEESGQSAGMQPAGSAV